MYEMGKVIDRIDWKLLREQKNDLLAIMQGRENNDSILGVLNLLDAIQDAVVEDGLRSEIEVFGEGGD